MRLRALLPFALCLAALTALAPCAPARAESAAAARLRDLAEQSAAAAANATTEEQAATRSFASLLDAKGASSEATSRAALNVGELALGQGRAEQAKDLASTVLDIVADSGGRFGTLAARAKSLLSGALAVQEAYAASAASVSPTLPYVDNDLFDRKLSDSLAAKQQSVLLVFPTPVRMKKIPDRLDKWLSAIEKTGGKVETVAVPETGRSFIADLFSLAVKLYDFITGASVYDPAAFYDATVHYRASTGLVVKVVFTLRESGK
jgi:hypothetical protein